MMKRLKADLAEVQNTGDDGGSIESFADEQQGPGMKEELEKIMEAEAQDGNDGMEQSDDGGALLQGDGPGELQLQQFSLAQGEETAKAQWRYYRYYIYYYRLYILSLEALLLQPSALLQKLQAPLLHIQAPILSLCPPSPWLIMNSCR
jgi:hypothetical protein